MLRLESGVLCPPLWTLERATRQLRLVTCALVVSTCIVSFIQSYSSYLETRNAPTTIFSIQGI
jgi:hypothetical protein